MTPLYSYVLQGSLVTAIFLLFYKLLLRRDTFFRWSRWYFIAAVLCSFGLPLIDVSALLFTSPKQQAVISYLPDLSFSYITSAKNLWHEFTVNLFFAGIFLMTVRLLMQMAALLQLRKNKRISKQKKFRIVELDERINPFSFFNEIYVNPGLHSEAELHEIIKHEQFHIQQKHTLDILLGEFLTIAFWFNPFAWFLKNELKQNLEFLTDKLVLQSGIDAKHYQYNLLKVSGLQNNIAAANHFHFLKLKNRIIMMNKQQTHPYRAVKFLLLVPVVALLLMAFTERKQILQTFTTAIERDTVPPPPPPPPPPPVPPSTEAVDKYTIKASVSPTGEKQLPKNVKQIEVTSTKNDGKKVTVTLKDGTKEVYDLSNEEDQKRFEKKYGKIAEILPPPPPGGRVTLTTKKPAELNQKGYCLSVADNEGECVVIVKDKNQKIVEAVKLTDWDAAKNVYENKYGTIPPVSAKDKTVASTVTVSKDVPGNSTTVAGITFKSTMSQTTPPVKFTSQNINALVIIDGVKQKPGVFNMNSIDPTTIESINILKDKAATSIYGDEGKDGVIMIKTKKKEPTSTIRGTITDGTVTKTIFTEPLYVVDGKLSTKDEVKKIEPDSIESINVLKGEQAITKYGDKGRNGVVEIKLR